MAETAEEKAIVSLMEEWQRLEDEIVEATGKTLEKASSPLVRVMMEIIQHDSRLHRHIEQIIIDSLEKKSIDVPEEELKALWDSIDKHAQLERRSVEIAEKSLEAIGGASRTVPQHYLISYLLDDEKKHEKILGSLALLKKELYG